MEETNQGLIMFGNIYPGNRNGADYVYIESDQRGSSTGGAPVYDHHLHVWRNTGSGGTRLKGDGVFYCDIRGAGADDYVWVSSAGERYLYGNIHSPPRWDPDGPKILDAGVDRKAIRLADFNGDGKCDLWLVDRATGAAEVWINRWDPGADRMVWDKRSVVTGDARCTEGWGVGLYDLGLWFHDINGDGRADYLCMEPDGRTTGALNLGENNFKDVGQVKRSEGYDRASKSTLPAPRDVFNSRANRDASNQVIGDKLVDFLWVDKFNGDTWVWRNEGQMPEGEIVSGSTFRWTKLEGPRYQGADHGANMHFPDLGGLGRADFHQVIPRTNVAYTWFNVCPGGGTGPAQDDQDPSIDPQLPTNLAPWRWSTPHNYILFGDSYSAGIGANCEWIYDKFHPSGSCRRCHGSYPWQLLGAGPELQGVELNFVSCSGAETVDLYEDRARRPQIPWIYADHYYIQSGWGTVSIGGNDLGFSTIASWCLFTHISSRCQDAIRNAETKLESPEFHDTLKRVYQDILLDAMGEREWNGQKGFLLLVTGYMQFFCDKDDG
ncbi:SGNH hydrolase-type esterase domain-containing protein [Aspergillus germanicus]